MKPMTKAICFTFFIFSFFPMANAALSSDWAAGLFELGNKAYERSDFDSAIGCYQKIIANGIENPTVYYNLANAFFRQNRMGYAVLYYEKAKVLDPDDEDIQANLLFARAHLMDKIPEPGISFFMKVITKLYGLFSLKTTTLIASALFFLICICTILGIFARYNGRLICIYAGMIFFLLFLCFGTSLSFKIYQQEKIKYAVVLSPVVSALNEPDGSQALFSMHEGTKFQIRKRLDNWMLISLPNAMAGWIKAADAGEI